jgi:predicted RNase H-like HicB family nuclease
MISLGCEVVHVEKAGLHSATDQTILNYAVADAQTTFYGSATSLPRSNPFAIFLEALNHGVPMKLRIVLEPSEDGGFTVFVPTLPGCISEGASKEEALNNIREAIELYLEPVEDDLALSPDAEQIELAV